MRKIIADISVFKVGRSNVPARPPEDGSCELVRICVLTIDSRIVVLKDSFVSDKKDNLWRLMVSVKSEGRRECTGPAAS